MFHPNRRIVFSVSRESRFFASYSDGEGGIHMVLFANRTVDSDEEIQVSITSFIGRFAIDDDREDSKHATWPLPFSFVVDSRAIKTHAQIHFGIVFFMTISVSLIVMIHRASPFNVSVKGEPFYCGSLPSFLQSIVSFHFLSVRTKNKLLEKSQNKVCQTNSLTKTKG